MNELGGLAVCHHRLGTVWTFSPMGAPEFRIQSCRGAFTTNLAYGGPQRRNLYITESEHGVVLEVELPTPGQVMFSHRG
jgi:gluconolactonase